VKQQQQQKQQFKKKDKEGWDCFFQNITFHDYGHVTFQEENFSTEIITNV
jgi:hypothetical protein